MGQDRVRVLAVTVALPDTVLEKVKSHFDAVHYHPDGKVPSDVLPSIDVWFCSNPGLPPSAGPVAKLTSLKHIQLISAGADGALANPLIKDYASSPESHGPSGVTLSTTAGLHVFSIPNYVIGSIISIFNKTYESISRGRAKKQWTHAEFDKEAGGTYRNRKTFGRTVGLLEGYGALGRETARLCQALGMRVIAANTSGEATQQEGYIFPGTGDKGGAIPAKYYSTSDPESLKAFLRASDVLVCSLPGTAKTKYLLDRHKLALLPKDAVFINVGRGSLIASDELEAALDVPDHLLGAAIDVTDPEPLPEGHPLWSHPKLLITPHMSGETEDLLDLAADILLANVGRVREGKPVYNRVNYARGY